MVTKKETTENTNIIKKNKTVLVVGLALTIAVAFLIMFFTSDSVQASLFSGYAQSADLPIYIIENSFVDIDADGDPDFLKYGEVILNPSIGGNPTEGNFQKGQP